MAPTRRARFRRRVYRRLPRWLRDHDFEVFAAGLGIFGGIPLLLGKIDPKSAEDLLPYPLVFLWGLNLVVGGAAVLVGVLMGSTRNYPDKAFWMRVEAIGLTAIAYFCYIYTLCLWFGAFRSGWLASIIILCFGIVSHVREAGVHMDLEEYRRHLGLREKA